MVSLSGHRVYVDASTVIYALEQVSQFPNLKSGLLDQLDAGTFTAVTSEITLVETVVGPRKAGDITIPEIERKGAFVPYTSLNGNMFTYLDSTGTLALRLPKGDRDAFLDKYQAKLCEAYGIVQKEYVSVPAALLENTDELAPYFQVSYQYAMSLKPKPSKKA